MIDHQVNRHQGFDHLGSLPIFFAALRIAARSTNRGTPVNPATRYGIQRMESHPAGYVRLPIGQSFHVRLSHLPFHHNCARRTPARCEWRQATGKFRPGPLPPELAANNTLPFSRRNEISLSELNRLWAMKMLLEIPVWLMDDRW